MNESETQMRRAENGSATDWASLLGRMFDDLSRVIQMEARLMEANFGRTISGAADRVLSDLFLLFAMLAGGSCLLVALIFLLDKLLEIWAALAIAGAVAIVLGLIGYLAVRRKAHRVEHEVMPH